MNLGTDVQCSANVLCWQPWTWILKRELFENAKCLKRLILFQFFGQEFITFIFFNTCKWRFFTLYTIKWLNWIIHTKFRLRWIQNEIQKNFIVFYDQNKILASIGPISVAMIHSNTFDVQYHPELCSHCVDKWAMLTHIR